MVKFGNPAYVASDRVDEKGCRLNYVTYTYTPRQTDGTEPIINCTYGPLLPGNEFTCGKIRVKCLGACLNFTEIFLICRIKKFTLKFRSCESRGSRDVENCTGSVNFFTASGSTPLPPSLPKMDMSDRKREFPKKHMKFS